MTRLPSPLSADLISHPDRNPPRGLLGSVVRKVRRLAPPSRIGRVLLIGPGLVAVLLLALLGHLTGLGVDDPPASIRVRLEVSAIWVLGYLFNVLPSLALAGLILLTSRRLPKGMPAVAVGTAIFTAFNLYAFIPMFVDDSSTGVLLFLFLPFYTGASVVVVAVVAWLVHVLRR